MNCYTENRKGKTGKKRTGIGVGTGAGTVLWESFFLSFADFPSCNILVH